MNKRTRCATALPVLAAWRGFRAAGGRRAMRTIRAWPLSPRERRTSLGARSAPVLQTLPSQRRTEVRMVCFHAEAALLNGLRAGQIDAL